jgi:2-polyprenyl-6-methoxyphenol hydroxylase-like FAD-dependent oxidoreductase
MDRLKDNSHPLVIAGAGIGGLAAALALAKRGYPTRVLEQAPEIKEVGAGIQLGPNSWRCLRELGVEPAVKRFAVFPQALVMMDSNYDSAPLHQQVCEPRDLWLVHPLQGQDRAGGKNREWKLRQMPATRRALVGLWERHAELMRFTYKARQEIERVFGVLTCTAGGLANLPAWVRGLPRVRRWVGVKIILFNARLALRQHAQPVTAA